MVRTYPVVFAVLIMCLVACTESPVEPTPAENALKVVKGDAQSGIVGTSLPDTIIVKVSDENGVGMSGVQVRFTVQEGTFYPDNPTTDVEGLARSTWTLGTSAGEHSADISVADLGTATLSAQALPGPVATMEISPSESRIIRFGNVQLVAVALDEYENRIQSPAVLWGSADTTIATVSTNGLVNTYSNGMLQVSGRIGEVSDSMSLEVYSVEYETESSFLSTPAEGHLWEMPVLVVAYLPTADGNMLDVAHDPDFYELNSIPLAEMRYNIDRYMHWMKFMLEEGSRFRGYNDPTAQPSLGYRIVDWITVYEPTPPNYNKPATSLPWPAWQDRGWMIDFHQIFARLDIRKYVEELGVKEIWFWVGGWDKSFPSYNPQIHKDENLRFNFESNMSSPARLDISNSDRDPSDLPIYDRTYIVYGAATRRTQAEGIHVHGHQLEAMFSYVNWKQDGNQDLFWKQFVGQDQARNFITGRVGWTHMPPNTTSHYDYYNKSVVASDIEDWKPDNTGAKKMVNVDTWANMEYDWPLSQNFPQIGESQWYIYWMQNMPGRDNNIPHGQNLMNNWWEFVGNWDGAMQRRLGLHTGTSAAHSPAAFTFERHVEPPPKQ